MVLWFEGKCDQQKPKRVKLLIAFIGVFWLIFMDENAWSPFVLV